MTIATDTIAEYNSNTGVTIDGVLVKDGLVDGKDVSAMDLWTVSQKSADYTLVLGDAHTIIENTAVSGIQIIVPTNASVAYPVGTRIEFRTSGGPLAFRSLAAVTIQSVSSYLGMTATYSLATLTKTATDTWWLTGELVAGWYIKDTFTTDRAAGAVHGTAGEPGPVPGTRAVADPDSRITIDGDLLKIAAGGSDDVTGFWYSSSITREAGRLVAFNYHPLQGGGNTLQFGLATATGALIGNHLYTGLRSLAGGSLFARATATVSPSPRILNTSTGTIYRLYQVMRAVGQYVFVQDAGTVKLLWIDSVSSTADLYFLIYSSGVLASHYSNVAMPALLYSVTMSSSDSFNRADGAIGSTDGLGHAEGGSGDGLSWTSAVGTAAIASNALQFSALDTGVGIAVVDTGDTDEFIVVSATIAGGVAAGVVTRYVDASNYIRVYHDGTDFKMDKIVAGVPATVATKTLTYAAGATIKVRCDGTSIWAWYNSSDADMEPITVADEALQTGTKHGVYTTDAGNTFENWYTAPVNGYTDLVNV